MYIFISFHYYNWIELNWIDIYLKLNEIVIMMELKETQRKYGEYRELSTSLAAWIRENTIVMQDRQFPATLIEVKKMAADSNRFRVEEIPQRLREKQHITRLYKDIEVNHLTPPFDWLFIYSFFIKLLLLLVIIHYLIYSIYYLSNYTIIYSIYFWLTIKNQLEFLKIQLKLTQLTVMYVNKLDLKYLCQLAY